MISTIPALQSGVQGFQKAFNGVAQNAAQIARNDAQSTQDLTRSLVELNTHKQQAQAAAKVIKTSHDMIGSLLDITV